MNSTSKILTDPDMCRDNWVKYADGTLPFGDWGLRAWAAERSGTTPLFLREREHGTVLPLGLSGEMAVFYGGPVYSERNGFLGPKGGEKRLLDALVASGRRFRLLSWSDDPQKFSNQELSNFDVPFNQFWIADPAPSMEAYEAEFLPREHAKEFRYLFRKFERTELQPADAGECAELIGRFFDYTIESFAKRKARSVYEDQLARETIIRTCMEAFEHSALKLISLDYRSERVGLLVLIDEPGSARATYLLNLYASSPSDISNGVTCAVIEYASRTGKPIDGLRGAFTLKKKFGFRAEPSYALVNDPSWVVKPQTDLSETELLALYKRSFGR